MNISLLNELKHLNSYLNQSYFDNPDKSSTYTNNIEDITSSLENLLNNIKLVLKLESDHKVPFQPENNEKIAENKYKILYLKAQLHKINDIGVLGIYTQSKNNKEILENIQKLLQANKDLIELLYISGNNIFAYKFLRIHLKNT